MSMKRKADGDVAMEDSPDDQHASPPLTKHHTQTGLSPLMLAAQNGHVDICRVLLEAGAPWNALDRYGKCAGNWAQENEHWEVVNLLVEEGTKAEVRA